MKPKGRFAEILEIAFIWMFKVLKWIVFALFSILILVFMFLRESMKQMQRENKRRI